MLLIGIVLITFIIFIFSIMKIKREKLSVKKYIALILLPSILLGVGSYVVDFFIQLFSEEHEVASLGVSMMLPIIIYGLILMLPALMFYAIHSLSVEKKFSPPAWKLFLWTGMIAGISALPYALMSMKFIIIPIVMGSLSMIIVYYVSKKFKV